VYTCRASGFGLRGHRARTNRTTRHKRIRPSL